MIYNNNDSKNNDNNNNKTRKAETITILSALIINVITFFLSPHPPSIPKVHQATQTSPARTFVIGGQAA